MASTVSPAPPKEQPPPGPGSFLVTVAAGLRDPLASLQRWHRDYGDVVTLRRGAAFLVAHPDGIKHVLQDNHLNYQKGARYRRALGRLMGDGLLTAEGTAWKRQRRLAQPAFLRTQHERFAETIAKHTQTLVADLTEAARTGEVFELHHALAHHSLTIMLDLMFSDDLQDRSQAISKAFLQAEQTLDIVRAFLPIDVPQWVPTPSNIRFNRALAVLDGFIRDVVAERRSSGVVRSDLLSSYLEARDEQGGAGLDDTLLRDEMITLLPAGHETVSDSITWAFIELMQHADAYDRVCAEADSLPEAIAPLALTSQVPFMTMVVQEALRLYPPGWGFLRTAIQEDVILGYRIPAGARVLLSPYLMHRDSSLWNDPDRFDPERFTPTQSAGRHRFAFFPFSAGPRQCIGAGMAMLEAQLTLALTSSAVRLELVDRQPIRPLPRVSLKPASPVMVRARARR